MLVKQLDVFLKFYNHIDELISIAALFNFAYTAVALGQKSALTKY